MRPFRCLLIACLTACTPAAGALQAAEEPLPPNRGELIEFTYEWPAVVEMLPGLREHLGEEKAMERDEATRAAREDLKARIEGQIPFNHHSFHKVWKVAAEGTRLLSLSAQTYTFTGGAHGMTTNTALLWDRRDDKPVERSAIFPEAALAAVNARYCAALDAERAEKRGEPVGKDADDPFNQCPALAEQTLAPVDEDANGRFDGVAILLDPYEAGPYAEGSYEVELGIDAAALAAIPQQYRPAFEVRR